jgi:hypothetical protein
MAKMIPGIEQARNAKQKPTEGEIFLLQHLEKYFGDEVEVYFQPCFNGDRPDIVILDKTLGIIIIEVKDWNLHHYEVDDKNHWFLRSNRQLLRSPFQQAYQYKKSFFDIHVNGLLEKNLKNPKFFDLIKTYVYFHGSSKNDVEHLYERHVANLSAELRQHNSTQRANPIDHDAYEKKRLYLSYNKFKFERDSSITALTGDKFKKLSFPLNTKSILFDESVYVEFQRLLAPPFHYANDGKETRYSAKQEKLIQSTERARSKICGLAGSGKTVVLAGRAVNAHRRHRGRVLILTFNITLCSYVHDRVSAVRSDFAWSAFDFSNYHRFITAALNNSGVAFDIPERFNYNGHDRQIGRQMNDEKNNYLEKSYYSNERIFEGREISTKYQTILVDEVQDYRPEWIKILRANFLEKNGEMVLFGDERQNIYGRALDGERRSKIVEGFGKWEKLTKSFRYTESSAIIPLAENFQKTFLNQIYQTERDDSYQLSLSMVGILAHASFEFEQVELIADQVIAIAKKNKIHPNDISIISSQELILQKLDHCFRTSERHQERTLCAFPALEVKYSKYAPEYHKISASKKAGFNLNSGVMKLSSTHSFKGFESPFIFLIVHDSDSAEMVLTGLTRAKENIVVYVQKESKFFEFFNRHLENMAVFLN